MSLRSCQLMAEIEYFAENFYGYSTSFYFPIYRDLCIKIFYDVTVKNTLLAR